MPRATLILTSVLMLFMTAQVEAAGITNGTADNGKHPYVGVAIFFVDGGPSHLCSASLLSPTLVLTAGHCTNGMNAARVYFDEIVTGNSDAKAYAGRPFTYPGFCEGNCGPGRLNFPGDVGVIVLDPDQAVPVEAVGTFASLPPAGLVDTLPNKAPIDLVGYGVNRQVQQPGGQDWIWDDSTVARKFAPTELVSGQFQHSDVQLRLALNPGGGSGGLCFGDSGGPNLQGRSNVVLAVNSWVNNSNCAGVGYGARIDKPKILAWINGPHPPKAS
jgi:secreted trypsin-like serine protease